MSRPAAVHVLNGDALAARFPESLTGQKIIVREMLMEGPLKADADAEFWQQREAYLQQNYPQVKLSYQAQVKPAFTQLMALPPESTVNLWFEHDLFCQANFWFCCRCLVNLPKIKVYFVQPLQQGNRWQGFGTHSAVELLEAYRQRILLQPETLEQLAALWQAYAMGNNSKLEQITDALKEELPFLPETAEAVRHYKHGKPEQYLKELLQTDPNMPFAELFKRFNAVEGRLGMGDLQLKRLLNSLKQD